MAHELLSVGVTLSAHIQHGAAVPAKAVSRVEAFRMAIACQPSTDLAGM